MMQPNLFHTPPPMTYSDFWRAVRRGWGLIVLACLIGLGSMILALHMVTPKHTITMVVGPTGHHSAASRGAQINVGNTQQMAVRIATVDSNAQENLTDFARFMELLTSPETMAHLATTAEGQRLLQNLSADHWDTRAQEWHPARGGSAAIKRVFRRISGQEAWLPPTPLTFAENLRRRLRIEGIGSSPMRRLILRDSDPEFAKNLLENLARHADDMIRTNEAHRTTTEIQYLRAALARETLTDHRRLLVGMLATQEQRAMMIRVDLPFAAEIIQKPHASAVPDWPPVGLSLVLGALLGAIVGVIVAAVKERLRMMVAHAPKL